ncbi:hypothetical protein D3C79_842690 [compost metagenome]
MVRAHIEQAEVAVIAQGDKAKGPGVLRVPFRSLRFTMLSDLFNYPAVVFPQLSDEAGMAGALGPLFDLFRAVVLGAALAHRLLEQGEQGRDMALIQGNDAIAVEGVRGRRVRHGRAHGVEWAVGAWGRLALGKPATTRW